jgi:hypothetical protein
VKRNSIENRPASGAPLNPVEAEVIHLFVQLSRALGHPCKIYNVLSVAAPVIYIGPQPSHVSEILEGSNVHHPWISVQHGEADTLADQILNLQQKTTGNRQPLPTDVKAAFSKSVLLPKLIDALEELRSG